LREKILDILFHRLVRQVTDEQSCGIHGLSEFGWLVRKTLRKEWLLSQRSPYANLLPTNCLTDTCTEYGVCVFPQNIKPSNRVND
jgi:hypothetical protein